MTTFTACGDVHLENFREFARPGLCSINTRCSAALEVLAGASKQSTGAEAFFVLGDLFDSHRPIPQVVAEAARSLLVGGASVYLLAGNHDARSSEPGDTALESLSLIDGINVIDTPTAFDFRVGRKVVEVLCVPWRSGDAAKALAAAVERLPVSHSRSKRVLLTHFGIRHVGTASYLADDESSVDEAWLAELCAKGGIGTVLAGHWHRHRSAEVNGVRLTQLGALVPRGFADSGLADYGCVASYSVADGAVSFERLSGPRFLKLPMNGLDELPEPDGDLLYLRLAAEREESAEAAAMIDSLVAAGRIVGGDVALGRSERTRTRLRDAVESVTQGDSIESAVAEYVEALNLPAGVSAREVRSKTLEFLNAS